MKNIFLTAVIALATCSISFGQGTVRGKITDKNGETIIGATVVLKENKGIGSVTDIDGNYSFKITDSSVQTLVVSFISFETIEEVVHPHNGEVVIKNFVLKTSSKEITEVRITAKAVKAKEYYIESIIFFCLNGFGSNPYLCNFFRRCF